MTPIRLPVPYLEPGDLLPHVSDRPGLIFLDSAANSRVLGRYSFLMSDPFRVLTWGKDGLWMDGQASYGDPWSILREEIGRFTLTPDPEGPPFRGGAAGFLGYELNRTLESIGPTPTDTSALPDLQIGLYDVVAVYDHVRQEAAVYSSGFPETDPAAREARAQHRAEAFAELLQYPAPAPERCGIPRDAWMPNVTPDGYIEQVERIRDWIAAGDIFQANYAQRFTAPLSQVMDPIHAYRQARQINPAPFGALMLDPEWAILSMSPERFLSVRDGMAETRPIKGTRPRHSDPGIDRILADDLQNSRKDRAENIMIVDLLRNDLSKVSLPGTVTVPELCRLESYASVHHLVSVVRGRISPGLTALDALKAAFPGGSITGAPKVRAMEIIRDLEGLPRHVYCGCIGYWGFDGGMDTNIAIRTAVLERERIWFSTGGGIVYLSDARAEYQESLDKAARIFAAFEP